MFKILSFARAVGLRPPVMRIECSEDDALMIVAGLTIQDGFIRKADDTYFNTCLWHYEIVGNECVSVRGHSKPFIVKGISIEAMEVLSSLLDLAITNKHLDIVDVVQRFIDKYGRTR